MTLTVTINHRTRQATRLSFLVAGLGMAAWAPIVPYAQARTGADEAAFGLLLLCLGAGSIIAMPLTGTLAARFGCRSTILVAGAVLCAALPVLALAPTMLALGAALFVFGAAIGTVDVAMNIQAVMVEQAADRPLMSGFHGLFSAGGIIGAGGVTLMLGAGLSAPVACLLVSGVLAALILAAAPNLLGRVTAPGDAGPIFVMPRGVVVVIGVLCLVLFLSEGTILDWSAIFLTQEHGVDVAYGGLGYVAFSVTMTIGRFMGDRIVQRAGEVRVLLVGGLLGAAGFLLAVLVPSGMAAIAGFALVGAGLSNSVPILFRAAGKQRVMPASLAISAITTSGYAGILAGPAIIGLVADATSLTAALAGVGVLVLVVAVVAPRVVAGIGQD